MTTTLALRRYIPQVRDDHGNQVGGYAGTVPWVVDWMAPGAMSEDTDGGTRDAATTVWSVCVRPPRAVVPSERDRVVVDGEEFEVLAPPKDWRRGPHTAANPGVIVELGRVSG